MKKFISVIILTALLTACSPFGNQESEEENSSNSENEEVMEDENMNEEDEEEMDEDQAEEMEEEEEINEEEMNEESADTNSSSAKLVNYSENTFEEEIMEGRNVVYFAATWCPTCKALNDELAEDISSLPSDLTIIKADYDEEVALKQEYGITIQHTLVQVDENGKEITRWSGGGIETIQAELQ